MTNCGSDNVITIDSNFTVQLNKKCEVISTGCVSSKGFTAAKVDQICMNKSVLPILMQILPGEICDHEKWDAGYER